MEKSFVFMKLSELGRSMECMTELISDLKLAE